MLALLAVLAISLTPATAAQPAPSATADCAANLLADGPKFRDYPAAPAILSRPAKPDVYADAQSKVFRTRLREGAAAGPNFAGHYTVVSFGCGAGCQTFAIVDAQDGRVFWPRRVKTLEVDLANSCFSDPDVEILRYRPDSRLIIAAGLINEDAKRLGVSYFLWEDERLKLIKFTPLPAQ
jgi:hypothetical protein